MITRKGNMWASPTDLHLVTANAYVKSNGCLVMGRGAASQAQDRFPGCAGVFGGMIQKLKGQPPFYGVLRHPYLPIGIFQVKWNWFDDADPKLISDSVDVLTTLITLKMRDSYRVSMNFPGIGNGRLNRAQVLPLITKLPDNVEVWEL